LDVAQRDPGGGDEGVPKRVGRDGLGDPGAAGGLADDPPGRRRQPPDYQEPARFTRQTADHA
jgi:hypothetical protein